MRRTLAALCTATLMLGLIVSGASAYSNGQLPESQLTSAATGVKCDKPLGQLQNEAAAAYNSMALLAGKRLPTNGCYSAYRPLSIQEYFWSLYTRGLGNLAAYPGTSNHGWGKAGDEATWVQGFLKLHGSCFGWRKVEAFSEPWHWNYVGGYNRPNPGTNLHSPILRQHSGGCGQGPYVRKVQKLLRGHGDKTVVVNAKFTHNTVVAVKRFQKAQRLPVSGVVSPRVWKRLRRPISKPVKTTPEHVPAGGTPAPAPHPHKHKPKKHRHHKKHHRHVKSHKAWGIDISSNNGCSIDFGKVRHDGATFAITKATEGTTYINPCFGRDQVRAIGAADLVPGVYHWLSPGGSSGKAEAAFFANTIGHAGYGKGFLQPFVDVEEKTSQSDGAVCHEVGQFVHTLKKVLGEKPIVYTYPGYVAEHLSGCAFLNHYRLWIAHLGVSHPDVPAPWSSWALWQYTWTAHVSGVPGDVDVSKVYGGTKALAKLRVRELPKRARKAPRARVKIPAATVSKAELAQAAPPPTDRKPLGEVPANGAVISPTSGVILGTAPLVETLTALGVLLAR